MTMLSQTAEYALRAVVYLAAHGSSHCSRATIAAGTKVPQQYLQRVLRTLTENGLVDVQRGPGGGFRLSRSAQELTVLDVVSATDPVQRLQSCPLGNERHLTLCPLHQQLNDVAQTMEKAFRAVRINDLVPGLPVKSRCSFPGKTRRSD